MDGAGAVGPAPRDRARPPGGRDVHGTRLDPRRRPPSAGWDRSPTSALPSTRRRASRPRPNPRPGGRWRVGGPAMSTSSTASPGRGQLGRADDAGGAPDPRHPEPSARTPAAIGGRLGPRRVASSRLQRTSTGRPCPSASARATSGRGEPTLPPNAPPLASGLEGTPARTTTRPSRGSGLHPRRAEGHRPLARAAVERRDAGTVVRRPWTLPATVRASARTHRPPGRRCRRAPPRGCPTAPRRRRTAPARGRPRMRRPASCPRWSPVARRGRIALPAGPRAHRRRRGPTRLRSDATPCTGRGGRAGPARRRLDRPAGERWR